MEKVSVLARAKAALENLDANKLVACYADDFLFDDVPAKEAIDQRDGLTSYYERLFDLPGVGFSDVVIYQSEQWAALEWTWSGSKQDSEERFKVRGASIIELREGEIRRETLYYDPRPALE
ncbi:MAG: hypothetical protein GTO49_15995 [Anaerolineae bacterium]|nr:hypothetical protein [Anaerolineae bacterium]